MNRFVVLPVVSLLAFTAITFGQQGPGAAAGGGSMVVPPGWHEAKSGAERKKEAQDAFAKVLKGELPLEQIWIAARDIGGKNPLDIYGSGFGFVDNVQIKLTPEQMRNLLEIFDKGKFFELDWAVVPPKGTAPPPIVQNNPKLEAEKNSPSTLGLMIGQYGFNVTLFRGAQSLPFSTLTRKLREAVAPLQASGLDLSKLTFQDGLDKVAKGEVAVEALQLGAGRAGGGQSDFSFMALQGRIEGGSNNPTLLKQQYVEVKPKAQVIQELAAKAAKANSAVPDRRPAKGYEPILAYDPHGEIDSIQIAIRGVPGRLGIAYSWKAPNEKAAADNPAAQEIGRAHV